MKTGLRITIIFAVISMLLSPVAYGRDIIDMEGFESWALKNTPVIRLKYKGASRILVILEPDKYTSKDDVQEIADNLARAYRLRRNYTKPITVTVWDSNRQRWAVSKLPASRLVAQYYPNPEIAIKSSGGRNIRRGLICIEVVNYDQYPTDLFLPSPDLPPCGSNRNSSRTWVDIYGSNNKKIHVFCAIKEPSRLRQMCFTIPRGQIPQAVYITLKDRRMNNVYKSNLLDLSKLRK
jgi:hypothetical protein